MRTPSFLPIEFIIVGGSLTGLSCAIALSRIGHKVTLLERDDPKKGTPIDGGCRVPPNATKIWYRWGMEERIRKCSVKSTGAVFAQYHSGSVVGEHEWEEEILEETGGEFAFMHYSDLRRILAESAKEHGATLRFNISVASIHPDRKRPSVTLTNGERLEADVVLGADGCVLPGFITRSAVMEAIKQEDDTVPSGTQVFHILIPEEDMERLEHLKSVRDSRKVYTWFGPEYGAHGYPLTPMNGKPLFTVFIYTPRTQEEHEKDEGLGVWRTERQVLLDILSKDAPEPRLMQLAEHAAHVACIPIMKQPALEEWIHPGGRVMCIGESAHPIPIGSTYALGMPAGDAAVIGRIFSHLHHHDQIDQFLSAVQEIRQPRVAHVLKAAASNILAVSLPPGLAETHDRRLREREERGIENLSMTSGQTSEEMIEVVERIFAYDPEDEADDWWVQWGVMQERVARWTIPEETAVAVVSKEEEVALASGSDE